MERQKHKQWQRRYTIHRDTRACQKEEEKKCWSFSMWRTQLMGMMVGEGGKGQKEKGRGHTTKRRGKYMCEMISSWCRKKKRKKKKTLNWFTYMCLNWVTSSPNADVSIICPLPFAKTFSSPSHSIRSSTRKSLLLSCQEKLQFSIRNETRFLSSWQLADPSLYFCHGQRPPPKQKNTPPNPWIHFSGEIIWWRWYSDAWRT